MVKEFLLKNLMIINSLELPNSFHSIPSSSLYNKQTTIEAKIKIIDQKIEHNFSSVKNQNFFNSSKIQAFIVLYIQNLM